MTRLISISLLCLLWIMPPASAQEPVHTDTAYINQLIAKAAEITDPDSGIAAFEGIRQMAGGLGLADGYLSAIAYIGYYLDKQSRYKQAKTYDRLAIRYILQSRKSLHRLAQMYNNLGTRFNGLGEYDSAVFYYYRAIVTQQLYGTIESRALPYNNLGVVFLKLDRREQAESMFKTTGTIAEQEKNHQMLAMAYTNLALIYRQPTERNIRDSFAAAAAYMNKALQIAKRYNFSGIVYHNLHGLGIIYTWQHRYREAIVSYEQSLELGRHDKFHTLATLSNMGHTYYEMKDFKNAAVILRQAHELALQSDIRQQIPYISALLGATYKKQGKLEQAITYYEACIEAHDSMKIDQTQEKVSELRHQYEANLRENEHIRKELALSRRQAALQQKNTIAYSTAAGVLMVSAFGFLYLRYRRRIEKQQEKQELEIASWRASLEGEEKERRRLARELHDNIGGNLSTVKMWLDNIHSRSDNSPTQQKDFDDVRQLVNHTITEVRNTAHHLMPELLLRFGLTEAVRIFCLNVQKASGIDIQFHYFGYIGNIGHELELIIYRTIQELVQNIAKHSGATSALVQMSMHEATLSITVEDNGSGITEEKISGSTGMGLQTARAGVEHSGGQFSVSAEPGNGTTVEFEFKLNL